MTLPPVTIVVLNWNARSLLGACLTSLSQMDYSNCQIVLVDNGSTDGSANFVKERFPEVSLVLNRRNLGFAAGNNVVLREIETPIIALVNPDVFVSVDWLRQMVEGLQADDDNGIAGCKLYYPGGRIIQHAGGYIGLPLALPGHHGFMEEDHGQCDQELDVDYVIGAAMVMRRSLLDAIGLLDEGYFLYFEDTDLCFRTRRAGNRVLYLPQAIAVHIESATGGKEGSSYWRRFHASRWRFLLKHFELAYLQTQTVPAEKLWLSKIGTQERRMANEAYRVNMEGLSGIQSRAVQEGRAPASLASDEWREGAAQILKDLRRAARQEGLYSLAEVSGRARAYWQGLRKQEASRRS